MMLPKLSLPTFFVNLISTGNKHKIRPYTSKEQEILLIAMEGNNKDEIINATEDLINNCVEGVDAKSLPIYDFEYLFLKLRIISSGEVIELNVPHADPTKCDNKQLVELNLNDIKIKKDDNHTNKIELDNNIGVIMRYPTMRDTSIETPKELLISCIESIYDSENVYPSKETTKEELEEWIGSLENKHIVKIKEFFDTMPKVFVELEYTCNKCGEKEIRVIDGFDNFFTTP